MLSFMTRASTATTFTLSLHDALPISREAEEISAAFFSGDLGQLTERQLVQACQGMPTTVLTEAELRSLSIVELLTRAGLAESKRRGRELIAAGAIHVNGQPVRDPTRRSRATSRDTEGSSS